MKKYVREVMIGLIALWVCFAQNKEQYQLQQGEIIAQNWAFNLSPNEWDNNIFELNIIELLPSGDTQSTFIGISYEAGRIKGNWHRVVEEEPLP